MSKALILLPNQLFNAEHLPEVDTVYLVEEPLIFGTDPEFPVNMHIQKLILHRASMRRYYQEVLWPAGYEVKYVEDQDGLRLEHVVAKASVDGYEEIVFFDPVDYELDRRIRIAQSQVDKAIRIDILDSPAFMLSREEAGDYFVAKHEHIFNDFYIWQRERHGILLTDSYKPLGGKWMYSNTLHHKLRADINPPDLSDYSDNEYVEEARRYVERKFTHCHGSPDDFIWPTNHIEADEWLDEFIAERLPKYADYQQAIEADKPFLYHGVISPMLNIGLLNPRKVIARVIGRYKDLGLKPENIEPFIRQILGWREFARGIYVHHGSKMRTKNYFGHRRRLSKHWYSGDTGLLPVDDCINKAHKYGYLHAAERQKIVGSAMLLSEIDPDSVYEWFMSMTIDAYDWVVVPNVYGLSQYADGGIMTASPQLELSEALRSCSHYNKSGWSEVWDGLYWGFIDNQSAKLLKDPASSQLVSARSRIDADKLRILGYRAGDFLATRTSRH